MKIHSPLDRGFEYFKASFEFFVRKSKCIPRNALLGCAALCALSSSAWAGATADQVIFYQSGDVSSFPNYEYTTASTALGPLTGDTTFGGLNPFNPPFDPGQMVILGSGGQLTLHLSSEVPANGRTLGVFANNGIIDTSADGSGLAASPPHTFSAAPQAIVSVSQDGTNFFTLNGGAPLTFDNPSNYYLDTTPSAGFQPLGTQIANQSKPFLGNLSSFSGQTFSQIRTTLNGSAGGTWIDLSGSGLPSVNYVRFTNPTGSTYRTVIDAVSGMSAASPVVAGQPIISESVGTGANLSHIVVDFGPQSYEFNVHYDGSITGEQALQMLEANTAFRFTTQTFAGFGDTVQSIDYGGYLQTGFGNNFWGYYLSTDGQNWGFSDVGDSSRMLTNGDWDGWVWSAQDTPPDLPIAAPEPTSLSLAAIGGLLLLRRRRARKV